MSLLTVALKLALFGGLLALAFWIFWPRDLRSHERHALPAPMIRLDWSLPQVPIRFDAERHEYWTEEGTRLPSVTEILRRVGIIDTTGFSREAARFGTSVHEATASIDRGESRLEDYPHADPRRPYLRAWELFKHVHVAQVLGIEQIVGGLPVGFAGTLDRLVMLRDGGLPVVVDLKSGVERLWHRGQLAGYVLAAGKPFRRMAVYLHPNGYANGIEFTEERDFRAFLGALEWVREGKA